VQIDHDPDRAADQEQDDDDRKRRGQQVPALFGRKIEMSEEDLRDASPALWTATA